MKGAQLPQSLLLGSLPALWGPSGTPAGMDHDVDRRPVDSFPCQLPSHHSTAQFTDNPLHWASNILPAYLRKLACLRLQTDLLWATPFRVYLTLNLQARDPPVGLHKAELLVQMFLKIDATPDPEKLKGYYGNTQLYYCVTL